MCVLKINFAPLELKDSLRWPGLETFGHAVAWTD